MRRALVRVLAAALAFAALPAGAAAPAPAAAAPPALRGLDERFVSGTPVETQDGPRPIEQVREGDWVLAWDEDAGELCWSRVEQTFVTPRQPIWRLTPKLPDGSEESLDCTPGHPFWADGEGWVPACHLQPGQDVATLSGPARVASVAPTGRNRTVYNFEVEGTHCYFVGAGGELVHNAPCKADQYALKATKRGYYPVMKRGSAAPVGKKLLDVDDVWKLGKTKNRTTRYSGRWLRNNKLRYEPQHTGTERSALNEEKAKLLDYVDRNGQLPPGNKVLR